MHWPRLKSRRAGSSMQSKWKAYGICRKVQLTKLQVPYTSTTEIPTIWWCPLADNTQTTLSSSWKQTSIRHSFKFHVVSSDDKLNCMCRAVWEVRKKHVTIRKRPAGQRTSTIPMLSWRCCSKLRLCNFFIYLNPLTSSLVFLVHLHCVYSAML